eukprot:UN30651
MVGGNGVQIYPATYSDWHHKDDLLGYIDFKDVPVVCVKTVKPTHLPTLAPTKVPSSMPTDQPSVSTPTKDPTVSQPTYQPSVSPTWEPTSEPSVSPTLAPTTCEQHVDMLTERLSECGCGIGCSDNNAMMSMISDVLFNGQTSANCAASQMYLPFVLASTSYGGSICNIPIYSYALEEAVGVNGLNQLWNIMGQRELFVGDVCPGTCQWDNCEGCGTYKDYITVQTVRYNDLASGIGASVDCSSVEDELSTCQALQTNMLDDYTQCQRDLAAAEADLQASVSCSDDLVDCQNAQNRVALDQHLENMQWRTAVEQGGLACRYVPQIPCESGVVIPCRWLNDECQD